MGSSDASYGCVFHKEDSEGKTGVYLSKELMAIAGHALKANITTLGPLVLPLSEQILFFLNLIARKVCSPFPRPTHARDFWNGCRASGLAEATSMLPPINLKPWSILFQLASQTWKAPTGLLQPLLIGVTQSA